MKLITENDSIDLVDATERAERFEDVRQAMKMGFTTPRNMTEEDRRAVRAFFARLPMIESVDPRRGLAKIIGEATLTEGWDWCFATSRDGAFGVFSLDEPSRKYLEGAVLHLWIPAPARPSGYWREDFTSLPDYQTAAMEAALAA